MSSIQPNLSATQNWDDLPEDLFAEDIEEWESNLMEEYPSLFANSEMKKWGILCGRGWEGLIRQICEKLNGTDVVFRKIKEKYGELGISVENGDEEIWKYLQEMEEKAMKVCEECGGPGNLADLDGWLFTMCEECAKREAQEYTWVENVQEETMDLELDKFCRTVII